MEPPRTIPMIRSGDLIFWRYNYSESQKISEKKGFQLKKDGRPTMNDKECPCKKKPISSTPPTIQDMSQPGYWHGVGMLMNMEGITYLFCMGVLPKKPILIPFSDFIARCKGSIGRQTQKTMDGPIDSYQICPQVNAIIPDLEDRIKGRIAEHIQTPRYENPDSIDDSFPVVDIIIGASLMKEPSYLIDKLWRNLQNSRWKYSHN